MEPPFFFMAGLTGLEPATSGVTGRRCNRLYYSPKIFYMIDGNFVI